MRDALRVTLGVIVTSAVLTGTGCAQSATGDDSAGAKLLRHLSPIERQMLADKVVSKAEKEQALEVQVACYRQVPGVRSARIDHSGSSDVVEAEFGDIAASDETKVQSALDACNQNVDAVLAVALLDGLSSTKDLARARVALRSCLEDAGEHPAADATATELLALVFDRSQADPSAAHALQSCADDYGSSVSLAPDGLVDALSRLDVDAS